MPLGDASGAQLGETLAALLPQWDACEPLGVRGVHGMDRRPDLLKDRVAHVGVMNGIAPNVAQR